MTEGSDHMDTKNLAVARRRVRRGWRLLDAQKPEWRAKLREKLADDGVLLDLGNPDMCVLGLVYVNGVIDPYSTGLNRLGIYKNNGDRLHGFEQDMGVTGEGRFITYEMLNRVWEQELIALGVIPTTGYVL